MIVVDRHTYKKLKSTDVKQFYKHNLQGQEIINPILGKILFTQRGLGETLHRVKRNLRPFICLLKEIVETGSCNGLLEPLNQEKIELLVFIT